MRYGIRDFLLVLSVVVGGLAISLTAAADDPPPAPAVTAETTPVADSPVAEQPVAEQPVADSPVAEQPAPAAPVSDPPAEATTPAEAPVEVSEAAAETSETPAAVGDEADDKPAEPPHVEPAHDKGAGDHDAKSADHSPASGEVHAEEHGEHHDPYDLTHVNATPKIADASEIKSDLAIWTFVVFLCLLALLAKFAWGPIMEGLERREARIAAVIDEAEQAAAKGVEQLKLYEAKLAAAAEETREILAQARRDAEAAGERIVAEAQAVAGREREKAVADITAAKNSALTEITERSVDLAVSMAGRMIQRQLTPDDRASLIREALDQLPNQN